MAKPGEFAPYIRTTIQSLKDALPGKIGDYNAESENEYDLDVPDVAAGYVFGGDDTSHVFPRVEVGIPTGMMERFSIQQVDAEASADLVVAIWLEGASGEIPEIYEKALGYGRVAAEVLMQPDACGSHTSVERMQFTFPTIPVGLPTADNRTFERWRTGAMIEISLEQTAHRD